MKWLMLLTFLTLSACGRACEIDSCGRQCSSHGGMKEFHGDGTCLCNDTAKKDEK